jgi:hypothetical protein
MNKFFSLTLATLSLLSPLVASTAEAKQVGKLFCRNSTIFYPANFAPVSRAAIKPLGTGFYELSFTSDRIDYLVKLDKNFKSHGKKERTHGQKGDANYELVHPMFEKAARNYVKRNGEFEVHVFLNGAGLCNARGKLKFIQGVEKRLFK